MIESGTIKRRRGRSPKSSDDIRKPVAAYPYPLLPHSPLAEFGCYYCGGATLELGDAAVFGTVLADDESPTVAGVNCWWAHQSCRDAHFAIPREAVIDATPEIDVGWSRLAEALCR